MRAKRAKATRKKAVAKKVAKTAGKNVAKRVAKRARSRAAQPKRAKPRTKTLRTKTLRAKTPLTKTPLTKKPRVTKAARSKRQPSIDRARVAALESEVRRLRSARTRLEHRLTAVVQEIGMLRQWELRASMLESELARLREEATDRLGGASIVSAPNGASN